MVIEAAGETPTFPLMVSLPPAKLTTGVPPKTTKVLKSGPRTPSALALGASKGRIQARSEKENMRNFILSPC
jgi:hypothetical protein